MIALQDADRSEVQHYGVIAPGASDGVVAAIADIAEKPRAGEAPSTLAVVGRYVLTPAVFDRIARHVDGRTEEIQLTDAIRGLLADERVLGYELEGDRYDCGSKLGYLKAQVSFGRNHPDFGDDFSRWLAQETPPKAVRRARRLTVAGA